ncbi:hypothetical protein FJY90_03005 [Candidatus Gottesmanbacteria bacterium]|nr:hypothetical protein [Candidatus Gottesmanbacteria bacterium]
MCRFLLIKSRRKLKPERFLSDFALMCQKSHAPDGDWQGDGWGIAIKIQKSSRSNRDKNQNWEVYKSLNPIWKDQKQFSYFSEANLFVVHARSAGFPQHKGNLGYNQPYVAGSVCFVFNGMLHGVRLPGPVEGEIGAQKVFSLLRRELKNNTGEDALRILDKTLLAHSQKIEGMNIGLIKDNKISILCEYADNASYFSLFYSSNTGLTLVCSERLGNYQWKTMKKSEVRTL